MLFEKIQNLKTLIRSDSSSDIGLGHIKRDLVLAKKIKDVSFACINLDGNIINEISYPAYILKSNDLNELIKLIKTEKIELLIIDHYGISFEDEKCIKGQTGVKILSFDDEYKEHYCDFLLNVNLFAKSENYKDLLAKDTEIYCGARFVLVRDEFYVESKILRDKKFDYFVGIGGSDVLGLGFEISKKLLSKGAFVSMATTNANKTLNELKKLSMQYQNFTLYINSDNIAKIMNESRELVIQASSFVNEAFVLKSKFKAIKTAKNQEQIYQWLLQNGYDVYNADEILKFL
ncbi:UDP-2,4-diacetamido-2,4,6-trideoxy-beta-L-altropyranosyl transferase [Campylobacter pinnipediorum subsp. caledonicus]|uniref:UDP-2,4-diacetamido-2,4, 6-trideoxy-beta-L-altropyranose hydrolase n=1 Tax=Campylobacter pinnipediorum TaxID=1965231 RepID=UPI0009957950|nr:UDP-2,4-diacetamido-2,4,6-trideoxy-beta-L-altropyranose hydrolase [Campylobacter pinnipediorum]AQW85348.1 UDP-2,4-diacetamido-2,4,6-trideoxy-beta-L-altropyranosyl transferase [Campylobacter pinnipediorum subsp. caledonicus]